MDRSPANRDIETVEGHPGDIITRGREIETLGQQMQRCADTLKRISAQSVGGDDQRGKAIDSLKESIGDAHVVLQQAAELYEPVGPFIYHYGEALEVLQPQIEGLVTDCERLWRIYETTPGDKDGSLSPEAGGGFLGIGGYDADSNQAKQAAAENAAKRQAYQNWLSAAEEFDARYDSWEDAFEEAAAGISNAMADAIKDSPWSDLTDALEIVALVIGVAAIILGGPLLAAAALVAGALLLLATYMAYREGERSGADIFFAAVSIVPFTKLSTFAKLAHVGRASRPGVIASDVFGLGSLKGAGRAASDLVKHGKLVHADGLVGVLRNRGPQQAFMQLFTGSPRGYESVLRSHRAYYEGTELGSRTLRDLPFVGRAAGLDFGANIASTTLRNLGYADMTFGLDTTGWIGEARPVVDAVL